MITLKLQFMEIFIIIFLKTLEVLLNHKKNQLFTVDLSNIKYISSGAIGMLLILLKYVENKKENLVIVCGNPQIRNAIEIMRLDKMMTTK